MSHRAGSPASQSSRHPSGHNNWGVDAIKTRLVTGLLSQTNDAGRLIESYIVHAQISEVSSVQEFMTGRGSTKHRIVFVASHISGKMLVHKARENADGSIQIGRTWPLEELVSFDTAQSPLGAVAVFAKSYFWIFQSPQDRFNFISTVAEVYERYTGTQLRVLGLTAPGHKHSMKPIRNASPHHTPPMRGASPKFGGSLPVFAPSSPHLPPGRVHDRSRTPSPAPGNVSHTDLRQPPPSVKRSMQKNMYGTQAVSPLVDASSSSPTLASHQQMHSRRQGVVLQASSQSSLVHSYSQASGHRQLPRSPQLPSQSAAKSPTPQYLSDAAAPLPPQHQQYHQTQQLPQTKRPAALTGTPPASSARHSESSPALAASSSLRRSNHSNGATSSQLPASIADTNNLIGEISASHPSRVSREPSNEFNFDQDYRPVKSPVAEHPDMPAPTSEVKVAPYTDTSPVQQNRQKMKQASPAKTGPHLAKSSPSLRSSATHLETDLKKTESSSDNLAESSDTRTHFDHKSVNNDFIMAKDNRQLLREEVAPDEAVPPGPAVVPRSSKRDASASKRQMPKLDTDVGHKFTSTRSAGVVNQLGQLPFRTLPTPVSRHRSDAGNHSYSEVPHLVEEEPSLPAPDKITSSQNPQTEGSKTSRHPLEPGLDLRPKTMKTSKSVNTLQRMRSPRSSPSHYSPRKYHHGRSTSASSMSSQNEEDIMNADFAEALREFGWTSDMGVQDLEKQITARLNQLNQDNVANVVDLDDKLDEIERYVDAGIRSCEDLVKLLAFFAVQLGQIGQEISHIEGQGEGIQVVTINQRNLVQELENLIGTAGFSRDVVDYLQNVNFDNASIPKLEAALLDVYRAVMAVGVDSSGIGTMHILQDRKDTIMRIASEFNQRFTSYLISRFGSILAAAKLDRVDIQFLRELYPLSSLVLFVKETNTSDYKIMLNSYQQQASKFYSVHLNEYFGKQRKNIETILGNHEPFMMQSAVQIQEHPHASLAKRPSFAGATKMGIPGHKSASKQIMPVSHEAPVDVVGAKYVLAKPALKSLHEAMFDLVKTISEQVSSQQQIMIEFFQFSSPSQLKFNVFIKKMPFTNRERYVAKLESQSPRTHNLETSRKDAIATTNAVKACFGKIDSQLTELSDFCGQYCLLESVYLMQAVEYFVDQFRDTDQEFLVVTLTKFGEQLTKNWNSQTEELARAVLSTHLSKKRLGVLPVVTKFILYISIVEDSFKEMKIDTDHTMTRKFVDEGHEKLYRALTQLFQRAPEDNAQGPGNLGNEDKETLNRHVTLIENMHALFTNIERYGTVCVQSIVLQAKNTYRQELEGYIDDVIHRPLGRIIDFVIQAESGSGKSAKPKHVISNLKRALAGFDSKEIRKGIETLRKRVEKHFGEEDRNQILFDKIWRAIGAKYYEYCDRLFNLAKKYDAEHVIDFSRNDVKAAFA